MQNWIFIETLDPKNLTSELMRCPKYVSGPIIILDGNRGTSWMHLKNVEFCVCVSKGPNQLHDRLKEKRILSSSFSFFFKPFR